MPTGIGDGSRRYSGFRPEIALGLSDFSSANRLLIDRNALGDIGLQHFLINHRDWMQPSEGDRLAW